MADYQNLYYLSGRRCFIALRNGKYGVIDYSENIKVPFLYTYFNSSSYNGVYLVKNQEGKYGFITLNNDVVLPFDYTSMSNFSSYGSFIATKEDQCGVVVVGENSSVKEVVSCQYDQINRAEGKLLKVKKDGKEGFIDANGNEVIPVKYDEISQLFGSSSNLYKTTEGDKISIINTAGRKVINNKIEELQPILDYGRYVSNYDYILVKTKEKKLLIDNNGILINIPEQIDEIHIEKNDLLLISIKGKFGIYSIVRREFVADPLYDRIIFGNKIYCIQNSKYFELDMSALSKTKIKEISKIKY